MCIGQQGKKLDCEEGEKYTTVEIKTCTITGGISCFKFQETGFQSQSIIKKRFRDIFGQNCGKNAYHVCIQGFIVKASKTGHCILGINELLNKCLIKMVEGNNFGVVKSFIYISFTWPLHSLGVVNIPERKKSHSGATWWVMTTVSGPFLRGKLSPFPVSILRERFYPKTEKTAIKIEIIYLISVLFKNLPCNIYCFTFHSILIMSLLLKNWWRRCTFMVAPFFAISNVGDPYLILKTPQWYSSMSLE